MDETREMAKIMVSGSRGEEHERECAELERRFSKMLAWLRRISPKILDVRQSTWYDDMALFRAELRKLELGVQNVMDDAFARAANVDDALRALHAFRYFALRDNLQRTFDDKVACLSYKLVYDCLPLVY